MNIENNFQFRIIIALTIRGITINELLEKCMHEPAVLAYSILYDVPSLDIIYDVAEVLDVSELFLMGVKVDSIDRQKGA